MRPLRQYAPIWITLKKSGYCRIAAPRGVHKRIIKAVSKEKYGDVGYKYELYEIAKRAELEVKRSNSMIEFKLLKIDIVRAEDL